MPKRLTAALLSFWLLAAAPTSAFATTWMNNVTVTKLNTYPANSWHFVWFSSFPSAECNTTPFTLGYDEAGASGKSATALLTAALLAGKPVDVQVNGCTIVEIYLHN